MQDSGLATHDSALKTQDSAVACGAGDSAHPHNSAACEAADSQPAGAHWQAPPPGPHVPPPGGVQVPVQLQASGSHERSGCSAATQRNSCGAGTAGKPTLLLTGRPQ